MEGASRLVHNREEERYQVVVLLDLPTLWQSERLKAFMERDTSEQTWTRLPVGSVCLQRFMLPANVEVHRFHELIQDEDYMHSGEVWLLVYNKRATFFAKKLNIPLIRML